MDTLPIVGRNHDLVIQSRMPEYKVGQLEDLAYTRQWGFEYYDKALCLIRMEDFPLFRSLMKKGSSVRYQKIEDEIRQEFPTAFDEVMELLQNVDSISVKEIDKGKLAKKFRQWKKLGGIVLDCMWDRGIVVTHHRQAYRRYYSLVDRYIPNEYLEEDIITEKEMLGRLLLRRVEQLGLLAPTGSPETLGVAKKARSQIKDLVKSKQIVEVRIPSKTRKYLTTPKMLEKATTQTENNDPIGDDRIRFIAPLDHLLWDRNTLEDLFNFDYIWEVYKPVPKRKYGYYCLPVLYNDTFLGRIDPKFDKKSSILRINVGYWEHNVSVSNDLRESIIRALEQFCEYLGAKKLVFEGKDQTWASICQEIGLADK